MIILFRALSFLAQSGSPLYRWSSNHAVEVHTLSELCRGGVETMVLVLSCYLSTHGFKKKERSYAPTVVVASLPPPLQIRL